ncbi:MAG: glycosyltransferase [Bacteroidota bacterium]|jgi:teichuronic acid biosynthesis glycosyltransferase TuaC
MKILFIIPYHPSPSAFIFSKRQAQDVAKSGLCCEIFYLNTKFSFINYVKELKRLRKLIHRFNPDVIHAQYGTLTAFFASISNNKPLVVTFQGSDINDTKDIHPVRNYIGKWMSYYAARKARKIICVSDDLLNRLKQCKEKAIVIPSGIDINIFKPIDADQCKRQLNLDHNKNYIFFNANNPLIKRLDLAKQVCVILSNYNVELLSLTGNIAPNEIPLYINASAFVLLCSDSEGSPMVIKEALACDVPIISVDVGDVKARINGVKNCFIVDQDPKALADQAELILQNPSCRTNGRDRLMRDGIDSGSITKKLIEIYNSAV